MKDLSTLHVVVGSVIAIKIQFCTKSKNVVSFNNITKSISLSIAFTFQI